MINKIKHWILNRKFIKDHIEKRLDECVLTEELQLDTEERRKIYTKAFSDAQADLKETQIYDVDQKAKELSEKRLNEMLSVVDMSHVISIDKKNGILYLGKERASDIELANLKAEAEFLVQSHIWKLLHETPKELAQRAMFVSSESLDDLKKGKVMLFTLDSQQNVVHMLRQYSPKTK